MDTVGRKTFVIKRSHANVLGVASFMLFCSKVVYSVTKFLRSSALKFMMYA